MSRAAERAELVLTCLGCGTRTPVARICLDRDGDLEITAPRGRLDQMRYSFVRELGAEVARPDEAQKVTMFCDLGHELQLNLPPIRAELAAMPPRRVRRAI